MCHCADEQPTTQNLYSNTLNTIFATSPQHKRAYSTGGLAQLGHHRHKGELLRCRPPTAPSRWRKESDFFALFLDFVVRLRAKFWLFRLIFIVKTDYFCCFRKKLSTICVFTLSPLCCGRFRAFLAFRPTPFVHRLFSGGRG